MAQLIWWLDAQWVGDMGPGDVHAWIAWGGGLQFNDVISIMAHPVVGDPTFPEKTLQVENVQAEGSSDGTRRIFFSVRNVGLYTVDGYAAIGMMLRPQ